MHSTETDETDVFFYCSLFNDAFSDTDVNIVQWLDNME
jgi:hypothetical protein